MGCFLFLLVGACLLRNYGKHAFELLEILFPACVPQVNVHAINVYFNLCVVFVWLGEKRLRFGVVLIVGAIIVDLFIFLQLVLPMFWPFPFWHVFGGFVVGLVVGALTKDLRRGILNGLLSVFLGLMIASGVLYFVESFSSLTSFAFYWLIWSLWVGVPTCVPAVIGGAVGSLVGEQDILGTQIHPTHPTEYKGWKYLALICSVLGVLLLFGGGFAHEFSETVYIPGAIPIITHPYRDHTYSLILFGLVLLVIGVLSFGRADEQKKLEVEMPKPVSVSVQGNIF